MKFAIDNIIDSWFDGITAAQVTEALAGLKDGETLELSINSPGGDVYEGIAIFNAIREVAKTHPVVVTINGLAASMASYIALAARTVDSNAVVKASDNSIFMIHNPYTGIYGDYKKFEKTASYLKQLAGALAGVYQSVSKKSEKDIRALMDETTFFVGNEIFENGFANEFEKLAATEQDDAADAPLIESRDALIVNAKLKIKNCYDKLQKSAEKDGGISIEKAAALLQTPAVSGKTVAAHNDTNTNGGSMNVEELKAKDAACYDAVFALGEKAGREKQSVLVSGHLRLAAKCGAYELAAKFIEEGKPVAEELVQDAYMDFAMTKAQVQNRMDDNPPATHTEAAENNADEKALMAEFDKGFFGKESERFAMAKIETSTVDTSAVLLGNNDFETGLLAAVPANTIVKAGTYLKRDGEKFAVLTNPTSEKVAGIVPFDVENEKSSVADVPFRALIAGRVRADKVLLNGNKPAVEQLDMLRACGIIPVTVTDVSQTA